MHMARAHTPVGVDLVGVCAARRDRIVGSVKGAARVSGASPRDLRVRQRRRWGGSIKDMPALTNPHRQRTAAGCATGTPCPSNRGIRKRAPLAGHERGGGERGDRERDVCHARRELHVEPTHGPESTGPASRPGVHRPSVTGITKLKKKLDTVLQ